MKSNDQHFKIWTFVDYNMLPIHGTLNRHYSIGCAMVERGHNVTVFVGSHPHNTNLQLIEGKEKYKVFQVKPFPWVLIKTLNYEGSMKKRIVSMFNYYFNARFASRFFDKPDVIIGSSAHPLCALLSIKLGKKYGAKSIVEIRDLWPESIVAMGVAKASNPIVKALYKFEKKIYEKADAVIFTFEGGYDYIRMKGWEKTIPQKKVFYLNNGINLKDYDNSIKENILSDEDLDSGKFLVTYTGAIKLANGLDRLVDCAISLKDKADILFLIFGDGDYKEELEEKCRKEGIKNIKFKGRVDKKYVPYILSKSSVNLLNYNASLVKLFQFGSSQNKLFDYLASGKPIIANIKINYDIIEKYGCGISGNLEDTESYVREIMNIYNLEQEKYDEMCHNARNAAEDYDFAKHAEKLESIILGLDLKR